VVGVRVFMEIVGKTIFIIYESEWLSGTRHPFSYGEAG